ncbi:hypothetical protein A2U01_0099006, partial [Trifolium medium]|nr:hypothetical protein [Trifolium medium]
REERVINNREKEIEKAFVVLVAATGFSGEGDVDLKTRPSSERGGVVEQRERERERERGGGGRSFSGEGEASGGVAA